MKRVLLLSDLHPMQKDYKAQVKKQLRLIKLAERKGWKIIAIGDMLPIESNK